MKQINNNSDFATVLHTKLDKLLSPTLDGEKVVSQQADRRFSVH